MKVLLVSHARKDPDAGASRVYHLLTDGLRERGHEVLDLHLDDVVGPRSRTVGLLARRLAFPRLVSRTAATRRPERFDVVMGSSGMTAPLFDRLARTVPRAERPALVHHLHGLAVYDHLANTTQHDLGLARTSLAYRTVTGRKQVAWDEHGIRSADVTVVQNLRDEGWLRMRFPDAPVRLVAPCLAPSLARHLDGAVPPAGRTGDLLWFGTWEARKGAHLVPLAFRGIRVRHPGTRLVLGGTGRPAAEVLADFDPRDRDAVEVLGRVPVETQVALFRRCALLLFPSLSEGFGLAPLEAAAFGCVPVLTPTGFGADHVTDGVDGLVVPPSPLHVERAVCRLLDAPSERDRMAARAQELAATFSAAAMVDHYEALFAEVRRGPLAARSAGTGAAPPPRPAAHPAPSPRSGTDAATPGPPRGPLERGAAR